MSDITTIHNNIHNNYNNHITDNEAEAENMRFLFCFKPHISIQCYCGCTLRFGTQILCGLFLTNVLTLFIRAITGSSSIYRNFGDIFYYTSLIISIFELIGSSFIFLATFNNNFKIANIGHIFFTIFLYLSFFNGIFYPFTEDCALNFFFNLNKSFYFMYYVLLIGFDALIVYISYVIFSFVKELGKGNFVIIDALPNIIQEMQAMQGMQGIHGNQVNQGMQGMQIRNLYQSTSNRENENDTIELPVQPQVSTDNINIDTNTSQS